MTDRRLRIDVSPDEGVTWYPDAIVSRADATVIDAISRGGAFLPPEVKITFTTGGVDVDGTVPWDAAFRLPDGAVDVPGRFRARWDGRTVPFATLKLFPTVPYPDGPVVPLSWAGPESWHLTLGGGLPLAAILNGAPL